MYFLKYTLGLLIFLIFLLFPSSVSAQKKDTVSSSPSPITAPVDSYKLFWPVAAGKVMGDSLYSLKIFKENFRGFFVFSELKKAEYNLTLSEKRTVEAEKLFLEKKDYTNGKSTLAVGQEKREKIKSLLDEAKKDGRSIVEVKMRVVSSLERQKTLLEYLATQVPEEQKAVLNENIDHLNSLLKSLQ